MLLITATAAASKGGPCFCFNVQYEAGVAPLANLFLSSTFLPCLAIHIAIVQSLQTVIRVASMNGGENIQSIHLNEGNIVRHPMIVDHQGLQTTVETRNSKMKKKIEKIIGKEGITLSI
jgi:hypothetical protein